MKEHNEQQLIFAKSFYQMQGLTLETKSNDVMVPEGAVKDHRGQIVGYHDSLEFFWIGSSVEIGIRYRPVTLDLVAKRISFKLENIGR